jgi:hypothetical protein
MMSAEAVEHHINDSMLMRPTMTSSKVCACRLKLTCLCAPTAPLLRHVLASCIRYTIVQGLL